MKRMRKFGIFLLLVFMTMLSSQTFWYLQDKIYCKFEQKNVTLFLKNEEWTSKCKSYLDTLYNLALKKYDEILTIRSYIDQWDDVYYRNEVLEKKKSELLELISYRAQIIRSIDVFEANFFEKYYQILQTPMKTYYSELEVEYYALINSVWSWDTSKISTRKLQLEKQMRNVSHVLNAKNLDDIMDVVPTYIYLKKQLEWK